jgi:hypothetical protein
VNIVDNQEVSLGVYTIIIDRYAEKSLGYNQKEFPNILCVEGESNSDVGASAFWSYSNPASSGNQFANEVSYLNEGFRCVYPAINEDSYDFAPIKELIDFIDLSSDDDFKDSFEQYFNKESVLKYYLFCLVFNSVDTLSKNLHLCRYNDVFYILPYDCDSAVGGNNQGYLNIPADAEIGDLYDENDPDLIVVPNHYNSWNSRLWARVRDTFNVDLTSTYISLRSNGIFTLDNILSYFDEIIDIIPPTMYNDSQQIKYIDYGEVGQIALHGNRKLQIKKHLRERLAYLDSKYGFYSDGGTENYVNLRMAKIGDVGLEIETYYPVYYTVKWATNNIETHRIAKGQKVSFSYYSDVSTDREVLLYLPDTIKTINGLNTLQPTTIDISKATKLNKIECNSEKLYSVSLATNKYLRRVDFNGCKLLGSDTTSTLSLMYAKYLNYVDIRGTVLNTVNFNPQGGSLTKCYLPNTLTSLTLKNQMLLTDLILPYGENGVDVSQNLATIEISNCPNIHKMLEDESVDTFAPIKHCRRLILNNSFDMTEMNFNGFTRLQNITLSNLESLVNMGLNDLCEKGGESSLRYVGVSACPNLKELTMNCTSDDYEITFADKGLLDLSTSNVTTINSNCVLKGLKTIVLPTTMKDMFFTKEYGEGNSDVINIWSARVCAIDSSGVFPTAKHLDVTTDTTDDYIGIDFYELKLRNIDLGALVSIPEAINFSLAPTTVNPNFNLYRDGVTIPYLQPIGTLDLSNYTASLAKFFNGVDLEKLIVTSKNDLLQTDYSYCFYNSIFTNVSYVQSILGKMTTVQNASYMFYKTAIDDSVSVMNSLNMVSGCIADNMFGECPNITNLDGLTLTNLSSASRMYYKCSNLQSAIGMNLIVNGSTKEMFRQCTKLQSVEGSTISGSTDMSYMFFGNTAQTNVLNKIPSTCQGRVEKCYANTNISNLKNFEYEAQYEGFTSPSLFDNCPMTTIENTVTIDVNFGKFTDENNYYSIFSNLGTIQTANFNVGSNCKSLEAGLAGNPIQSCSIGGDAVYTSIKAFICCSNATRCPINFDSPNIKDASYFYYNCPNISGDIVVNGHFAPVVEDLSYMLANTNVASLRLEGDYSNLKTLEGLVANTPITELDLGEMIVSSNLSSVKRMCANTSNLKQLILPQTFENSTITNLEGLCLDSKPTNGEMTITNFRLPQTFTELGTNVFGGISGVTVYNVNLKNVYIPNNGAMKIFSEVNTTNNTYNWVKSIDGIEFNPNYETPWDFSNAFKNCSRLTNDFVMPDTTLVCNNCFENCINMTHINSNWKTTFVNGITPTDCYKGCTGITHCNGIDLGVNEFTSGLDEVPVEWGGYGFLKSLTGVYTFEIPSDNYTLELEEIIGTKIVRWGDGAETTGSKTHTYAVAGTYTVKGMGFVGISNSTGTSQPTASVRETLIEVVQVPSDRSGCAYPTSMRGQFNNCLKLRKVNLSNMCTTIERMDYIFANCPVLENVNFGNYTSSMLYNFERAFYQDTSLIKIDGTLTSTFTPVNSGEYFSFKNLFRDCRNLKLDCNNFPIKFPNLNINVRTDASGMFGGCGQELEIQEGEEYVMDFSKIFPEDLLFGDTTYICSSTKFTKIIMPKNAIVGTSGGDGRIAFGSNTELKEWIGNGCTFRSGDFYFYFNDCQKLETVDFTDCYIQDNYLRASGMFGQCYSLKNVIALDLRNAIPTNNGVNTIQQMFNKCREVEDLSEVLMPDIYYGSVQQLFNECSKLKILPTFENKTIKIQYGASSMDMFKACNFITDLSDYSFIGQLREGTTVASANEWYLFLNGSKVEKIGVLKTGSCCRKFISTNTLTTINEFHWLKEGEGFSSSEMWIGATNLQNVTFFGTSPSSFVKTFNGLGDTTWGIPPFSRATMVSLFNSLGTADTSGEITTLHMKNYSLLTPEDIAIATAKGWTIVSA